MSSKIKKRPLFKKKSQIASPTKDQRKNVYGRPMKKRSRSAAAHLHTSTDDNHPHTTTKLKPSPTTTKSEDNTSDAVEVNSCSDGHRTSDSVVASVTEELLDNALFGVEENILTPLMESSPISDSLKAASTNSEPCTDFDMDILSGLCPEDLNFSLNSSSDVTSRSLSVGSCAVSPGNTAPGRSKGFVRSSELLKEPNHVSKKPKLNTVNDSESFYGLPLKVKECFEEFRGIKELYDWQHECLSLPCLINGDNLIYSLPTSGGKTLVAEVLILKQLLCNKKEALLILPFVSIVQEKVRQLTDFSSSLGFAVEEYAASKGQIPPRQRRKKRVLYVATIEKANGLVNSLIELGRVDSLGLVVVDELHMLGEGSSRGATLESCLAKVQATSPSTQLVGMSATLSNITQLATFMRAQLFTSSFRPVELVEQVKLGQCVYRVSVNGTSVNFDPVRDVPDSGYSQLDPDQLTALVSEVVPHSSCLIFCSTKKSCQNVALLLTRTLPRSLRRVSVEGKQELLSALSREAAGVCPVLAQTLPYGVAYHHSGLTADERRVLEEGYLKGTLCVFACTSTLAAGVNLPAKRVILRSPYVGSQLMSRSQYKQMVGRAGRSGLCDTGDSVLVLQHRDKDKVMEMLSGPYGVCESSLMSDSGSTFLSLLLNIVGLQIIQCFADVQKFLQSTLLYVQRDHTFLEEECARGITRLVAMGYLRLEPSNGEVRESEYLITSLGRAAFKGCLPVEEAHLVYQEMRDSQRQLVLSTDLHLLFLATPPNLGDSIQPNWMVYFQEVTEMGEDELKTAQLLGVKPGLLSGRATGSVRGTETEEVTKLYQRFYITLILHSLLKMSSSEAVWRVASRFHCSRGFLQSVLNSTASHSSCLVHFTAELPDLWPLHLLLPALTKKLAHSSHLELAPLMEVSGLRQGRARQLYNAGITTPGQLAAAHPNQLVESVDNLFPKQARQLIRSAKALLTDQAELLLEEAEQLMTFEPTPADDTTSN